MRLWIPGGGGLLGSALSKLAGKSALPTGRTEADIADIAQLRAFAKKNPGISHIANCAAFSLVDLSETKREEAFKANVVGPENLATLAKEIGAKLVHISTDYVYPGDLARPLKETDPVRPLSYYGQTKLEGEERVLKHLPDACIIRTSWVFGHGGKNFVAKLLQMFQEKEEIRLTADQWGRPTYAPDLAAVILKMLDKSGIYHFANAGAATKFTFGCAMRDLAEARGLPVSTKSIIAVPGSSFPSPCKRPSYTVFDTSKIEKVLKTPIRSWQDALSEYLCEKTSS